MAKDSLLEQLAVNVGQNLIHQGLKISTAESCTGGWIAKSLTDIPGSSQWFERGLITYSNRSKQELLGVDPALLAEQGAVSQPVVLAMAEGILKHSPTQLAIAVSGIAGPAGGTTDKPVGTVWIAWGRLGDLHSECYHFDGDRDMVRYQTVLKSLEKIKRYLD